MKNKILNGLLVIILLLMVFILTGCDNKSKNAKEADKTVSSQKDDLQNEQVIYINRTEDFVGDYALVHRTINYERINYIIDKNFKVLSSYKGNAEYKDGYIIIEDEEDKNKMNIKDCNGNVVFSYNKLTEYNKVELLSNGCIITEKQTDTYNTSSTVTGIYDLKEQKYILEPEEKYNNNIKEYGDNMIALENKKTFFNLLTKKIIEYKEDVMREFKDGYSVDGYMDENFQEYIRVFDMEGNSKLIKSIFKSISNIDGINGMLIDGSLRIKTENYTEQITGTNVQLFDFEEGTVKDLSDQFIMLKNQPLFTKEGYALIEFNNQGGTPYYTVIDKKGNKLFEPQKVNDNAAFEPKDNGEKRKLVSDNLEDGNYFIVTDNGVYTIIDKNNKVVLTADENEIFDGITNNVVKVHWKKAGYYDDYYYKDLQGNKISIIEEIKL